MKDVAVQQGAKSKKALIMKIEVIAATINETDQPFTLEQLQKLSDTATGVPIYSNFDEKKQLGKVIRSCVADEKLMILVEMKEDPSGYFIVPGYIHPEFKCVCFGLTDNPADKTLEPIKVDNESSHELKWQTEPPTEPV